MSLSNPFLEINGVYPKPAPPAPLSGGTSGKGTPPSANTPGQATNSSPVAFAGHNNVGPVTTPAQAQVNPDDHRYVINTRSFAPPASFGGGLQRDSRDWYR